jgi:uncharacterized protein YukE
MNGWCAQVNSMKTYAGSINVSANDWGAVGAAFASEYATLHSETVEHLGRMETWLGSAERAMKASAQNYANANSAILDAINALGKNIGGSEATAAGDAPTWSLGDPQQAATGNAIPLSNVVSGYNDAMSGEFGNLAGDIGNFAANAYLSWVDPVNALATAGVGFLESVITPLQQLVAWVTGNPSEISKRQSDWASVRQSLTTMLQQMVTSLSKDLATWEGEASNAAKKRIAGFLEGVQLTIIEIGHIEAILDLSAALMTAALDVVNGILANLVEWLILLWVATLAGAPVTGGADIPIAEGATEVKTAMSTQQGAEAVSKVAQLLKRMQGLLQKIRRSLKGIAAKNYQSLAAGDHKGTVKTKVWKNLEDTVRSVDEREGFSPFGGFGPTFAGAGASVLGNGVGQSMLDGDGNPFDNPSSEEIDRLLNPGE